MLLIISVNIIIRVHENNYMRIKIIKESNQYVYLPVKLQRRILRVFRFRPPPRRTSLRSALVRRCSLAFAPPPPRSPRNSSSQSIPHRTIPQCWIRKSIYKSINVE